MILKKASINNFRSIKHLDIEIEKIAEKNCSILLGVNETGKTNILLGLSMLNKENQFKYDLDCEKEARNNEKDVEISFLFELEENEKGEFDNIFKNLELPQELKEFFNLMSFEKVIKFNKKSEREEYYNFIFKDRINYGLFSYGKKSDSIVLKSQISEINSDSLEFEDLDEDILNDYLEEYFQKVLDKKIPEIIFWKSSKKYLISEPVPLKEFGENPSTISIPLRNIFNLSGLGGDNLKRTLERVQKSASDRSEIEEVLSESITKHINKLWPEHKININIRIESSNLCEVSVSDKDNERKKFNIEQRSDGFKQFVSILLTLSAENKTQELKNKIILLDEPERSLHPSSTKYLKDVLLDISKDNVVFISSHSIYMVDKKNLNRHYTVSKQKGQTFIDQIDKDNPLQEEVIYEALGTTIYEILEPNILIFEGRTDKELFEIMTLKLKSILKPIKFKAISATGATQIPKYAKFFNNKLIKGFIVVDSDGEGRGAVKSTILEEPSFKSKSFELSDLCKCGKKDFTMEDLLPEDLVLDVARNKYDFLFSAPGNKPIMEHIKFLKREQNINLDAKLEELKTNILKKVIADIKKKTIQEVKQTYPLYVEFLETIHKKIK